MTLAHVLAGSLLIGCLSACGSSASPCADCDKYVACCNAEVAANAPAGGVCFSSAGVTTVNAAATSCSTATGSLQTNAAANCHMGLATEAARPGALPACQ